jgi:general secretion pathway protein G
MTLKKSRDRYAGFTLIEVLLVLAILVILAALVVPNLSRIFSGSQVKAARTQIELLDTAIEVYKQDVGTYPNSLDALLADQGQAQGQNKWRGPYLKKQVPLDPWSKPYQYQVDADGPVISTTSPEGEVISSRD